MAITATTETKVKGEISWNLPPIHQPIVYQAGQPLDIKIAIKNPTDAAMSYVLTMSLFDPVTGQVVITDNVAQVWGVVIDLDAKTFTLSADKWTVLDIPSGESLEITGSPTFPLTDVGLALTLWEYDKAAKKPAVPPVASLNTALTSRRVPAIPDIIPLITMVITVGMLGFMIRQLEKIKV